MNKSVYTSPIGKFLMESDGECLVALRFVNEDSPSFDEVNTGDDPVLKKTTQWLDDYFSGKIPSFTPPLKMQGTPFRMAVWDIVAKIPYGETITYGDIARQIARQRGLQRMSAQAVGGAVGSNPIPIIVPCHRVVGSDGSLTGYAGGLDRKRKLLELENTKIVPLE